MSRLGDQARWERNEDFEFEKDYVSKMATWPMAVVTYLGAPPDVAAAGEAIHYPGISTSYDPTVPEHYRDHFAEVGITDYELTEQSVTWRWGKPAMDFKLGSALDVRGLFKARPWSEPFGP